MTTASVPILISCPDWCTSTPEEHAADLWEAGGECHHSTDVIEVPDPVGYVEPLKEPKLCAPFELLLVTAARPDDGRETASPLIYLDGAEHTVEQMEALAESIGAVVATYREARS